MKKKQDKSVHASALQIAIALALVSLSTVLIASGFAQRSAAPTQNVSAYAFQGGNAYAGEPDGDVLAGGGSGGSADVSIQEIFSDL